MSGKPTAAMLMARAAVAEGRLTPRQAEVRYGVSASALRKALRNAGVPGRPVGRPRKA